MIGTRTRRVLTGAGAGAAVAALAISSSPAPAAADGHEHEPGRFDVVHTGFMQGSPQLEDAQPESMGLDPAPIDAAWQQINALASGDASSPENNPMYSSAVGLMAHQGNIVSRHHMGYALQYADDEGTELPDSEKVLATDDTIYDMASVSKLFTAVLIMQLVEEGTLDLDATYASYIPEFGVEGKEVITVRQMLTHTTGMPAWLPLWSAYPDKESRIQAVMAAELTNDPGTAYEYSDLNLIALGVLAEQLSGQPLDVLLEEKIANPLGLTDTEFNPSPDKLDRIAATEYQATPDRGIVRGEVHDENAWSLGGVAGHAGVFSTVRDIAIFAQTMLNGGSYGGARILQPETVQAMITDETAEFAPNHRGLGFELDQMWYMGALSSPATAGHTGFTGTSVVIDFQSRSFVVLLTNRVHPSRDWGTNNPARRAVADGLAASLKVQPQEGRTAWFGGATDDAEHTLSVAVPARNGQTLTFDAFADIESSDEFALESSVDGGQTWELLPWTVTTTRGGQEVTEETDGTWNNHGYRTWGSAVAQLPASEDGLLVRWRYTTDATNLGRGVYVDDIAVWYRDRRTMNIERTPGLLEADGFTEVQR